MKDGGGFDISQRSTMMQGVTGPHVPMNFHKKQSNSNGSQGLTDSNNDIGINNNRFKASSNSDKFDIESEHEK